MAFLLAIKNAYVNITTSHGRTQRSEYWWFIVFLLLLGLVPEIGYALCVVMAPPIITLSARRLHDIGKSGWSQLLFWVSCIGWIFLLRTGNLASNSLDAPSNEGFIVSNLFGIIGVVVAIPIAITSIIWLRWMVMVGDKDENRYGPVANQIIIE